MCHIICSEPNSPTFGWGIPHYFFSQSGLQNPHNGENSPLLDTLLFSWIRINVEVIKKHPVSRGRRDVIFNGCHLTSQVTLGSDSWMILTPTKSFEGHRQGFLMNRKSWCEKCECDAAPFDLSAEQVIGLRRVSPPRKEAKTVEKFYLIQQILDIVTASGPG